MTIAFFSEYSVNTFADKLCDFIHGRLTYAYILLCAEYVRSGPV